MKIEVRDLVKVYETEDMQFRALDGVNFSVESGEFISITGRTGSGKSTLLNIIAGLTLPTSGTVLFDGSDIFCLTDKELSLYRSTRIGFVPQTSSMLSNLSVLDNVRLPFHFAKREGDCSDRAYMLLELFGLEKMARRMPKHLSGGQVKRVAIARALMNKPNFILADEPTNDLDAQTTKDVMSILKTIVAEGTTVLMVTHDLEATEYADRRFNISCGVLSSRD